MENIHKITAKFIASQLGKASPSGEGYVCCCPAHNDEKPSLSVTDTDDGRILVHCHAGCSQEKVISTLIELNLWPAEAIYPYLDQNGELRYQVVRSGNKSFRHRQPDGSGNWIWNVQGVSKVPYRLPELLEGIKAGQMIFVTEGEKDCDNLAFLGLVTTTNSGGACKWNDELSSYLKGAEEVVILPDNDEPGLKHGHEVALSLNKLSIPTKVVILPDLPEKGDVSDWLATGGTKEQLLQLCTEAPHWVLEQNTNMHLVSSTNAPPDWSNPETFGDPILFGEIETPEITSDFLPTWIKNYVDAVAEQTQTPVAMGAVLALAILSACLQKRYEVSPLGNDYTEPLTIWSLVALPPASRKSAVLTALTAPIMEWEASESQQLKEAIDRTNIEREVTLKKIEVLKKRASIAQDSKPGEQTKSREELQAEIWQLQESLPDLVIEPKVFVTDITPESLQNELANNGERMAIISDEGNIFEILAGLYSDGISNIDVFLQGHAGGPIRVERSARHVQLKKIAVTLGLAIQPQVLTDLKNSSKKSFRGRGLLARFLFCLPQSNIGSRDVRNTKSIPPLVKQDYFDGIKKLLNIPMNYDTKGSWDCFKKDAIEKPRLLTLTDEALECWLNFSQWIESQQGPNGKLENLQDWTGKLPGHASRIAGLCHVAQQNAPALSPLSPLSPKSDNNNLAISKEIMEPVINLCKQLIVHAQSVFDLMEMHENIADAKYTLHWILTHLESDEQGVFFIRQNALHSSSRFKKSRLERVIKGLEILRERNIVSPRCTLPTQKPTYIYYVNPSILTLLRKTA